MAALAVLVVVSVGGCADDDRPSDGAGPTRQMKATADIPPKDAIDEDAGTFRGVGFGHGRRKAVGAFGDTAPIRGRPITPLGRKQQDIHSAPAFNCWTRDDFWGPVDWLLYEDVSFFLASGAICEFTVIEEGAATKRGVAIGDPLADAERAYPELECGVVDYGREHTDLAPTCVGRLGPLRRRQQPNSDRGDPGRWIWFGGDPIDTIQMNNRRFEVMPRSEDG